MGREIDRLALLKVVNECATLSEVQKEDLWQLIGEQKKYGLVWENKTENAYEQLRNHIPVMEEDRSKAITHDSTSPNHVIIEGDNLNALTNLAYTHTGKIDVIYIDPPYNTGNRDFVYNDHFVDKNDGFRHSEWLSFMDKRLKIAKQLLSDTGVIFISIDDNEQAQLKILCDEVFGEGNFVANICRLSTKRIKGDAMNINIIHDYILSYSKSDKFVKTIVFQKVCLIEQKKDLPLWASPRKFVVLDAQTKNLQKCFLQRNKFQSKCASMQRRKMVFMT